MRDVAPEYGITDVGLKKVCKKLGIPTPPQGHWIRSPARRLGRPPLPPLPLGVREEVQFRKWVVVDRPPASEGPKRPPELEARLAKECHPAFRIVVADRLMHPHTLVQQLGARIRAATPMDDGFLYLASERDLDVNVSKAQSRRALRLLDALFKALEARGCPVTVAGRPPVHQGWPPPHEPEPKATRTKIGGEWVALRLTERWRMGIPEGTRAPAHLKADALRDWEYFHLRKRKIPAGRLRLQVCAGWLQVEWNDGPEGQLEQRLNEVVAGLFELAHSWKERREAQRLEEARREKLEQERRHQEWLRERERKRVRHLLELAARWGQIREASEFLSVVKAATAKQRGGPNDSDPEQRLAWAEATLSTMDPVREFIEGTWD